MSAVFADTFYWIALTHPTDAHHRRAGTLAAGSLCVYDIITTEEILTEYLAFFSDKGSFWRTRAVAIVHGLRRERSVQVLTQTTESFQAGFELYAARPDKGYSLTDCIAMQIMRREGLTEALTNDQHFEQEGFRAIFRSL